MTSSPNSKPLNPEAQPFPTAEHFLMLPHQFFHCQPPPLPFPPAEQWRAGLFYKHPPAGVGCYHVRYHQPPLLQGVGFDFPVANSCGGGAGGEEVVKRKERFRRPRKVSAPALGSWRRRRGVSEPSVLMWRPKTQSKSNSSGGGVTVHASSPPPPPPPPPPRPLPISPFYDVGNTTVMIRNIPNQYRRNMLLDFLDEHCQNHNQKAELLSDPLHMAYDFLYLPMDFRSGDNLGYAFLNLTSSGAALRMREMLHRFKWGTFKSSDSKIVNSKKVCEITWARIQGKDNLVRHFQNSIFPCGNVEYLPAVLAPPRDGSATTASVLSPIGKCLLLR
ncbi:protein terminal ear1-like [Cornus florida]|uniref:protein terminal ear1-like n=1 Tax=Cornus florida TaxID=4283 RepID=UPI0028971CEE|nr:protein terminal ear1-like [Cornus florida]